MKYKTKHERMIAIWDAYRQVTGKTCVTTEEVAEWAVRNELYPVPRRGDDAAVCEEWERRLERATAAAPAATERGAL